jgi:Ca2+-transporting ATPase
MRRPPRQPDERLFSRREIGLAVLQGLSVFGVCIGGFLLARTRHTADAARALTFATLVAAFIVIILVNRSWTRSIVATLRVPNTALRWVVGGTAILLAVVLFVPFARRLFHFAPLHLNDLVLSLAAGLICVLWSEALKRHWRRRRASARLP